MVIIGGKASISRQPDAILIKSQMKFTQLADSIYPLVKVAAKYVLELLSNEQRQYSPQHRLIASGGRDSPHLQRPGIPGGYPASLDPS